MGEYVASRIVKLMIKKRIPVNHSKLLMLGITFKENCPDVRNTKIVDVIKSLQDYGISVSVFDPWANPSEVKHEYGLITTETLPTDKYDTIVLGVAHNEFLNIDLEQFKNPNSVVYDVKGVLKCSIDGKL
jgi:UDP-N-acetyl-D-galactosamine dehydrogenase